MLFLSDYLSCFGIYSIRGKLKPLYFESDVLKLVKNEELDDDIKVFPAKWKGEDFDGFDTNPNESGTRFLDADINIAVGILLLGAVSKKSPQPVTSSEANPKIKSIFFIMVLFLVQLMIKI